MHALIPAALGMLAMVVSAGALGFWQSPPSGNAEDPAVRGLVRDYVAARERQDPAAVGALFTADADQLVSSGEWRRGRDELVKGTLASSQRTGGNRSIAVETIRYPAPNVAIADGRYEITGGAGGDRRMWSTFVMVKEQGAWRIAAIRNMLPAPPAQ